MAIRRNESGLVRRDDLPMCKDAGCLMRVLLLIDDLPKRQRGRNGGFGQVLESLREQLHGETPFEEAISFFNPLLPHLTFRRLVLVLEFDRDEFDVPQLPPQARIGRDRDQVLEGEARN